MVSEKRVETFGWSIPVDVDVDERPRMWLHQEWVSGKSDDGSVEFTLAGTGGLGGATVLLRVDREGQPTIQETVDFLPLVEGWVDSAIERADARAKQGS